MHMYAASSADSGRCPFDKLKGDMNSGRRRILVMPVLDRIDQQFDRLSANLAKRLVHRRQWRPHNFRYRRVVKSGDRHIGGDVEPEPVGAEQRACRHVVIRTDDSRRPGLRCQCLGRQFHARLEREIAREHPDDPCIQTGIGNCLQKS